MTSSSSSPGAHSLSLPLVRASGCHVAASTVNPFKFFLSSVVPTLRSLLLPACHLLPVGPTPPTPLHLTGTFFGHKKGRVSFALQGKPHTEPILLLDLATQTSRLAREMAAGAVRIVLECERSSNGLGGRALLEERVWAVHCNMRRLGYAVSRSCAATDLRVLGAVRAVSFGAGVVPGDVMYMRAKFERVIGSTDSEAFYMISPDCGGREPELSIFLLRM